MIARLPEQARQDARSSNTSSITSLTRPPAMKPSTMKAAKNSIHFTLLQLILIEAFNPSDALQSINPLTTSPISPSFSCHGRPSNVKGCRRRCKSPSFRALTAPLAARQIYAPSPTALCANPAEALFPSDDSDYESTNRPDRTSPLLSGDKTNAQVVVDQSLDSTSLSSGTSNFFQISEISHPTQQKLQIGSFVVVDPVDAIADWVSELFVEQSVQWRSSSSNDSESIETAEEILAAENLNQTGSGYILESYSPGSVLDMIAQASATHTPLSYQIRTIVRVMLPSILLAIVGTAVYPSMVQWLIHLHTSSPSALNGADGLDAALKRNNLLYTDDVLVVVSNDLSQYIQNILTTCALLFGMLVGQTVSFLVEIIPRFDNFSSFYWY